MINIFIITAEHHFIQVEQAVSHFRLDKKDILVWFLRSDEALWIERIIREKNSKDYIISDSWNFSELKNKSPKIDLYIQKLREVKQQYQNIRLFYSQYASDFSLLAIKIFKPSEIILMDEGTASFIVCKNRSKLFDSSLIKLLIKSFYYKIRIGYPKRITLFTQYNLKHKKADSLVRYQFAKEANKLELIDDEAAILGSSMVEVGLLEESYYLGLLSQIKEKYHGKKLLYFSHRKESIPKKDKIREMGFEIIDNEVPFEFYFEKIQKSPAIIGSFFTPTLLNLASKFQVIPKFVIFKFDMDKLLYNKDVTSEIYKSYEGNDDLSIEKL